MSLKHSLALVLALSLTGGCGSDERNTGRSTRSSSDDEPRIVAIAGGVGWEAEEPLVADQPDNDMREAQYAVRGHPDVQLTVSAFEPHFGGGGSVQGNIDRWLGQMEAPGGQSSRQAARIEERQVEGLRITVVDIRGTFVGQRGMASGAMEAHAGWRLLGAIAEGGPEGLVFFKMTGPQEGVDEAEAAFDHMLASLHLE